MASGKKNYFRHSFFARNDEVIMGLIDQFGFKGYFFWFALLEMCGEQASDEYPAFFKYHESRLYRELRCSKRTLIPLLDYLQTSLRLVYNKTEKYYQIDILNFPKYMGRYETKKTSNTTKERKEKERKEKESTLPPTPLLGNKERGSLGLIPDDVVQLWNEMMPSNGFNYCKGLGSSKHRDNFLEARNFLKEKSDWINLFQEVLNSPGCCGENDSGWRPGLVWLVDYDNAIKVLNSDYQNKPMSRGEKLQAEDKRRKAMLEDEEQRYNEENDNGQVQF